jgi:hypothetical protein
MKNIIKIEDTVKVENYTIASADMIRLLEQGIERQEKTNFESALSRLEWVKEQNPEIDIRRVNMVPELHDIACQIAPEMYRGDFRIAGIGLLFAASLGGLAYLCFPEPENQNQIANIAGYVGAFSGLAGAAFNTFIGLRFAKKGLRNYSTFKSSQFSEPLSERERTLADYVFMADRK